MPDKIDPPHATGAAEETVKKHSSPHQLVFHAVSAHLPVFQGALLTRSLLRGGSA